MQTTVLFENIVAHGLFLPLMSTKKMDALDNNAYMHSLVY